MSFQLFRGTSDQVSGYNGADGEIVYNMTNKSLHVFDGVTVGGYELKNAETIKQELLDGASAAYDTLKEIEDYISSNEGSVGTILTNITNLQTQVNQNKTDVQTNQGNISSLQTQVNQNKTDLQTNQGNISSLLTSMSTKADKPASPTGAAEALSWNGSSFQSKNIGVERRVNGADIEFIFG